MVHTIAQTEMTFDKEMTPEGDLVKIRYFLNRQPAKAYELNSKLGKQCAGLQLIVKDLEIVLATLKLAQNITKKYDTGEDAIFMTFSLEDSEQLILSSLVTSSIVTYAKHFTQGNGLAPFIHKDQIRKVLDAELLAYHEKILDLRHTWIAHGGVNEHEIAKTIVVVDTKITNSFSYVHHVHFSTTPIIGDIEKFIILTSNALSLIRQTLHKRSQLLWNQELLPISLEEHHQRAGDDVSFIHRK